jgi:glutamyl-tRNA reductase
VAVELAEKIFDGSLAEKSIMIVGAGKMGEACLRHLAKRGAKSVMVSNRSVQRAEDLARELGGRAIRIEDCLAAMVETDIVVSSTGSPTTVLHRRDLEPVMRQRNGRPLFLIDIAVPRDIEPEVQMLENVYLYDIDDLEELVQANVRLREQELARCCDIIAERAAGAVAKIWPEKRISDEPRIQPQPRWVFGSSAACPG